MSNQLEIGGIGYQKVSLSDWKKENDIRTHHAPHMKGECPTWSCWDEFESPEDFLSKHGDIWMGFGDSEKEAIMDFCLKCKIELPFWW